MNILNILEIEDYLHSIKSFVIESEEDVRTAEKYYVQKINETLEPAELDTEEEEYYIERGCFIDPIKNIYLIWST